MRESLPHPTFPPCHDSRENLPEVPLMPHADELPDFSAYAGDRICSTHPVLRAVLGRIVRRGAADGGEEVTCSYDDAPESWDDRDAWLADLAGEPKLTDEAQ